MSEVLYQTFVYPIYLVSDIILYCFYNFKTMWYDLFLFMVPLLILICPFLFILAKEYENGIKNSITKKENILFYCCCLELFLLIGVMIPTNLFISAPRSFPFSLIYIATLQSMGTFIVFPSILYSFIKNNFWRKGLLMLSTYTVLISLLNIASINNFGQLSPFFYFQDILKSFLPDSKIYLNFVICCCISVFVAFCFYKKKIELLFHLVMISLISTVIIIGINTYKIANMGKHLQPLKQFETLNPQIHLTKTGKNVIVFMMDRGINSFLPIIFEERPELKDIYTGFTYYPNTVSYYGHTILGLPPILGGYEYTPLELNKRSDSMADKFNEAVLVLPTLFKNANYNTTVVDVPWTDFSDISEGDLYKRNGINYLTFQGRFLNLFTKEFPKTKNIIYKNEKKQKRNILPYAILIASPSILKTFIYNDANYFNTKQYFPTKYSLLNNYPTIFFISYLTDFTANKNTFTFIDNMLPHAESLLELPNYTFTGTQEAVKYKVENQTKYSYHTNAATFLLIGEFIKYLKENGVYDNTRIIIVADHGYDATYNKNYSEFFNRNVMSFNPLLFVKDFNAKGRYKTDYAFMTNADTPLIALKDIVAKPINPFTNKEMASVSKQQGAVIFTNHKRWNPKHFPGSKVFDKESVLMKVKDNIFDENNFILDYKPDDYK